MPAENIPQPANDVSPADRPTVPAPYRTMRDEVFGQQLAETAIALGQARADGVPVADATRAMRRTRQSADAEAIAGFLATLDGLSLHEAMLNVELDARSYGWSRTTVRKLASKVRLHFAGRR